MVSAIIIKGINLPAQADGPDWDKGLPTDVLAMVAGGRDDLKGMREVCKSWQIGFEARATTIILSPHGSFLPPGPALQERFPALSALDLAWSLMHQSALGGLQRVTSLCSLKLGVSHAETLHRNTRKSPLGGGFSGRPLAFQLKDAGLERLRGMALTGLHLGHCWVTDTGLQTLQSMPLQSLSLAECKDITDSALRHLRGLPLTRLDLGRCPQFTNSGLENLQALRLRELDLNRCEKIDDQGLYWLRKMPLTRLSLRGCSAEMTGAGFEHLLGMPLTRLDLGRLYQLENASLAFLTSLPLTSLDLSRPVDLSFGSGLTDEGIAHLRGVRLRELRLNGVRMLTSSGLASLRGLPLEKLDIGWCWRVTDPGLEALRGALEEMQPLEGLAQQPPLTALDLTSCGISDRGLAALRGLPLESLILNRCMGWTNAGLAHLRELPLKCLQLNECEQLRDEGLERQHGMGLTRLGVEGCEKITLAGVQALRRSIDPVVHVRFWLYLA